MSAADDQARGEQTQTGLFGEGELPAGTMRVEAATTCGRPRVMSPQRNQVELRAVDLEAVLAPDHPARTVWAFVQSLDLAPLYARIKSVEPATMWVGTTPRGPSQPVRTLWGLAKNPMEDLRPWSPSSPLSRAVPDAADSATR